MADIAAIRSGIQTRLKTISALGSHVYDRWPDQIPDTPAAVVLPSDAEYEQNFGNGRTAKMGFEVYLFVSLAAGYAQAQTKLDPLLATSSTGGVYGAIHADRRLNSLVDKVFVKGHRNYDQVDAGDGVAYAAAVVDLEVWQS